jgi:serine protease Do
MIATDLEAIAGRLRAVTVQVRVGRESAGCGIIWSPDGLIVSNAHVARSEQLAVELPEGHVLEGRVWRRDPRRDLALIGVPAQALPVPMLGDVETLRPGEIAVAVGHPFGVNHALAVGVIHQLSHPSRNRWLRADIRLAPGNSGGPLANSAGEVIGVNTLIAGGLAHAIPVTAVKRFVHETGARAA